MECRTAPFHEPHQSLTPLRPLAAFAPRRFKPLPIMTTTLQNLREKRGFADTHRTPTALVEKWRMEVGSVRLWIIGPGSDAMHPASQTYYSGRIGTELERQIAQRAVEILDRTRRDHDAGKAEIQAALDQAANQIANGLPFAAPTDANTIQPLPPAITTPPITQEQAAAILLEVQNVTGILVRVFMDASSPVMRRRPLRARARTLCYIAAKKLHPGSSNIQIADAFGTKPNTVSQSVRRHEDSYINEPTYAAQFKTLISKIS